MPRRVADRLRLLDGEGVGILINDVNLIVLVRDVEKPFATREGHPDIAGAYAGLPAALVFLPSRLLLGEPPRALAGPGGKVPLLECPCSVEGCWPFLVRILVGKRVITWCDYEQPHRCSAGAVPAWSYSALRPFTFERTAYERALIPPASRP